jgi:hypothetical protein
MGRLRDLLLAALGTGLVVHAQNPPANLIIDVQANRHAIKPEIYGVAFATPEQLRDLNVPLNRSGGNNASRYNWKLNADNRGADWYFQSLPDSSAEPNERLHTFITKTREGGAEPMLTIPMIGWVAKLGPERAKLASFSQTKYGRQTNDDWRGFMDAGNGILREANGGARPFVENDPNDANIPNSPEFQAQSIRSLMDRWGTASSGGPRYYHLDNEPSIWHESHRDIQPTGATMEETLASIKDYAAAIKSADPAAIVMGPEEWGWNGYLWSGYDLQYSKGTARRWVFPDRARHGDMDYIPWLLEQLKADGRHLLDIVTVHYYPQGGEFSNDVSTATQLLRNRSTRSLWDPEYVDQSWIRDNVMLIPRLRNWVNAHYDPGTPIGITEYNWGAENHINGATAQADVLGILGREGVDLAARWMTPASATPAYKAIQMYRNYDGQHSTFGDVSVSVDSSSDPDNLAAFAAQRTSDGALTVMVISKVLAGETEVNLTVSKAQLTGAASAYQLTSANTITKLSDVAAQESRFSFRVPAQSITLLVLPMR